MKRKCTEWEKMFANHVPDKVLVCRIYKELFQHKNVRIQYNSILKLVKDLNTFIQRRSTNDQQVYIKVLNITNHQRNAN